MTPREIKIVCGAAAIGLTVAVGAYVYGRQSAPAKVETKTETKVEYVDRVVEKTVYVKAKDVAKKTTTTTSVKPDGSSLVVKVEDLQTHTDTGTLRDLTGTSVGSSSSSGSSTVDRSRPGWRLSAGAEWGALEQKPDAFRVGVDRRIVGPLWLGVEGSTDKRAGVRVGLEF